MRIVELTAFPVRIPLRRPVRHASHTRHETDNLVIRCTLENGTTGYGEGVPREYVTGETVDTAVTLLQRSDLREQLDACGSWNDVLAMVERVRFAPIVGDDRQCQGNAARCALELAILDAYGRHFGQPLSSVTSLLAPDLYEPRDHVRYSTAITSARGWKARAAALMMRVYRFRQLKVKVGIAGYDDVSRLRNIRRCAGRSMDIRIDANEAWSPEEVVSRIRELEPFGITSVEQPVAHEQVLSLVELRKQVHTPIMLDESLCSLPDAKEAARYGFCDLFNIRLSKCGGFIGSLRIAQYALQYGLAYQLGCQVGETAILSAAGRHFASSVKNIRYLEGSYDRHLVAEALGTTDLTFGLGGKAPALTGPGLGISVDPEALQRVALRKETLVG